MPDRATSAAAAEWTDVLDQYFAEVEVSFAENAGHFVHDECPDLAAREIDRFFSGLAVRLGARDAVMGEPG